jgi:hypothetical protein
VPARWLCVVLFCLSTVEPNHAQLLSKRALIAAALGESFELIDIDTLFYIHNQGIERVWVNLNGYPFKLAADPEEVQRSQNAFLIPQYGEITLNIAEYILPCNDPNPFGCGLLNMMSLRSQGPAGAEAEVIVGDLLVPGQTVAFTVTGLEALPERFALLQSYPNPFADRTTLTFSIPEQRTMGLSVRLTIYDVIGRPVRQLADARYFPGHFSIVWDGTDQAGQPVAAGIYFGHIMADAFFQTVRLIRLR